MTADSRWESAAICVVICGNQRSTLFSPEAIRAIYQFTQGYPRRIAMLCHDALERLVMHERPIVDEALMQELMADESRWLQDCLA